MARKLIDHEEAARILGVTPEEVGSLRDRKKLFPYRDGAEWKYKQEDLERLKAELDDDRASQSGKGGEEWTGDSHLSDVELELNDDLDSILLSEVEMGGSAKEGMSTIIGKMSEDAAGDADLPPAAAGSRAIVNEGTGDSGITLASDSGITLSSESEISLSEGGSTIPLGMDSDVKLVSGSDLGQKAPGGSSDKLFGSDALRLSDDELSLVDSGQSSVKPKSGDSGKRGAGSSIKLGDEEIEVVLGGGSDITQRPSDSGIQLISASDSGLSLDQPLALGSSARKLLDSSDAADLSELGGEAKPDDDFLLTALDDAGAEESSDSGSQVIALDSDDEISSGMFAPLAGGAGLLEEEPGASGTGATVVMAAPSLGTAPAMMTTTGPAEAPYSGPTVAVLAVCVLLLLFCGMMTFDLMRNMWSWDGPYTVNSSIMDSLGSTIGWFEK
jgi:hypothetical protein